MTRIDRCAPKPRISLPYRRIVRSLVYCGPRKFYPNKARTKPCSWVKSAWFQATQAYFVAWQSAAPDTRLLDAAYLASTTGLYLTVSHHKPLNARLFKAWPCHHSAQPPRVSLLVHQSKPRARQPDARGSTTCEALLMYCHPVLKRSMCLQDSVEGKSI
ncbi:hypothetical protein BDW72DRAFT_157752 [Aspergillus terricola var. indicus]